MTRRWYLIAGEWHLERDRARDGSVIACACRMFGGAASSCETSTVPAGHVCPDCYRSTKTQSEIDDLAARARCVLRDDADEIALLIGATRA